MKKHVDAAKKRLRLSEREIFFLGSGCDARLVTSHGPWKGLPRRKDKVAVIFLQPFAEEMNRCRRLISLSQDALSARGICSLTIDYLGTGDSAGAFEDASLKAWTDDVNRLCDLAISAGAKTLQFVGVRFGALLAETIAASRQDVTQILALQPQESYMRAMRQFIRIAAASLDETGSGTAGVLKPSPAKQLEAGARIMVGGYEVTPELYSEFKTSKAPGKIPCPITAAFVGVKSAHSDILTSADRRTVSQMSQRAPQVHYVAINDVQLWHQGIPEEPRVMPSVIADILTGNLAKQDIQRAA
ncbi:MAG: hypothetical protein AAF221_00490 [Pseudomonadota bacterium]